ncbi:hypothetical protein FSHL1_005501 [Fusarium sambucinum]
MSSIINSILACESGQPLAPSNTRLTTGGVCQPRQSIFGKGHSRISGRIIFNFGSNIDNFKNGASELDLSGGWGAILDISATDIIELMQGGLHVCQENVKVHESYIMWSDVTANQEQLCYRHYALTDPKWSGSLVLRSKDINQLSGFRLEDISPDRVFHATVAAEVGEDTRIVYFYEAKLTGAKINVIMDDEPLPGLWPWPKKELANQGKSEESFDMGETPSGKSQDVQ